MSHEAYCGLVDHLVEDHQVLILELVLCLAGLEVVVKVVLKLGLLLPDVRKIDEEPKDHISRSLTHLSPLFVFSKLTLSSQNKLYLVMPLFLKC